LTMEWVNVSELGVLLPYRVVLGRMWKKSITAAPKMLLGI
jgi:hypothetical protein